MLRILKEIAKQNAKEMVRIVKENAKQNTKAMLRMFEQIQSKILRKC